MEGLVVKAMKNGMGEWAVFWGTEGKAIRLAYKRFFKTKEVADKWVEKYKGKFPHSFFTV